MKQFLYTIDIKFKFSSLTKPNPNSLHMMNWTIAQRLHYRVLTSVTQKLVHFYTKITFYEKREKNGIIGYLILGKSTIIMVIDDESLIPIDPINICTTIQAVSHYYLFRCNRNGLLFRIWQQRFHLTRRKIEHCNFRKRRE